MLFKEYSEIQKKCDKESYFDLVSLYNEVRIYN